MDLTIKDYHACTGRLASEAMRRRAERGLPCYRPPLGYRLNRTTSGSQVVIDPRSARFVRLAFAMVAAGNSLRQTLQELTSLGMRSQGGKEIGPSSFWAILHNPFYLGLVRHRGETYQGGHQRLVTGETFATVKRRLGDHHGVTVQRIIDQNNDTLSEVA